MSRRAKASTGASTSESQKHTTSLSDKPCKTEGQPTMNLDISSNARVSSVSRTNIIKLLVLLILCLQNSVYTVLRRYSQGILKEQYSKYEVLLLGEIIKIIFSACVISSELPKGKNMMNHIKHLTLKSSKMFILAFLYGTMNILSFVALKFISAATFTILAQCKIVTTAAFSALMLRRQYSWAKWRALTQLMLAVLLFSAPALDEGPAIDKAKEMQNKNSKALELFGTAVVLLEVTLSGFSSIYFEKAIKTDSETFSIWERNFQLALWSFPIYVGFILWNGGGTEGYGGGWSYVASMLSLLGAAGGLLVALSIKYTDSIMKTLAVTGSIVLSSFLDHALLSGPMTTVMIIAAALVILSICNYTFDTSPVETALPASGAILLKEFSRSSIDPSEECEHVPNTNSDDEIKEK